MISLSKPIVIVSDETITILVPTRILQSLSLLREEYSEYTRIRINILTLDVEYD